LAGMLFGVVMISFEARSARAEVPLRTAAATGLQAEGTSNGVIYDRLDFAPMLDAEGRVTFFAHLAGANVTGDKALAIYSEGGGTLNQWAASGFQADDAPEGQIYCNFEELVMNRAGRIAFIASLTGETVSAGNDEGVWSNVSGLVRLIALKGSQISD